MALGSERAVTGKLRRCYRVPNVIKFIADGERPIERDSDHDLSEGFRPINKSDPPAGKETPCVIIDRSIVKTVSRVLLSVGLISSSRHGCRLSWRFCCMRDK